MLIVCDGFESGAHVSVDCNTHTKLSAYQAGESSDHLRDGSIRSSEVVASDPDNDCEDDSENTQDLVLLMQESYSPSAYTFLA